VLILDVNMPGLSGLDVCRRAKEMGELRVLIVSGESGPDDLMAGYAAGADDYLTKPFRPHELVARVRRLLGATEGGRS
jgi:DNA-binding response OmpR family regulator